MSYHAAAPRKKTRRRLAEDPQPDEPEWVTQARHLRRVEKWSYQHIADHLREIGAIAPQVPSAAAYRRVYKRLNRERVRATDQKHRGTHVAQETARRQARWKQLAPLCVECGTQLYRPPKSQPPICLACRRAAGQRKRAAIAGLALAGHTPREIARLLELPEGSVNTTVSMLRDEGMPIPYRRRPQRAPKWRQP